MEKCLLYLFSIGSQFLDFIHWMVFDLFFYCVTVKTIYTTQVNSTFRARWLASSEVISQVLFTSEQPKKNVAFVAIFSQRKLLFGPLVIQLVWYILKQLFTSESVKVVDIYLAALRLGKYPPLFTSTSGNNCSIYKKKRSFLSISEGF